MTTIKKLRTTTTQNPSNEFAPDKSTATKTNEQWTTNGEVLTLATTQQDSSSDRVTGQTRTTQCVSITDVTARSEDGEGNLASTTASTYDNVVTQGDDVRRNGSTATTVISTRNRVNISTTPPSSSGVLDDFNLQVMSGESA